MKLFIMTDEEKREQRNKLKLLRGHAFNIVNDIDHQIADLCHKFIEEDLLSLGFVRGDFNGPHFAYEYDKGNKTVIFHPERGSVQAYWQSYVSFDDMDELAKWSEE